MNSLSWLIYWADTAPSLAMFVSFLSFFGFLVSCVLLAINITEGSETRGSWIEEYDPVDDKNKSRNVYKYTDSARIAQKLWFSRLTVPLFLILWGASFLVPSKDTFYLIAASQAGEDAIKTPEFTKVRSVINKWLDNQLSTEDKKDEPKSD